MTEDCIGCAMSGKTTKATKSRKVDVLIHLPCPDAYEYSLKGTSCLSLHHKLENRTEHLCDEHYKMVKKYDTTKTLL